MDDALRTPLKDACGSVSELVDQLRSPDASVRNQAAAEMWRRFSQQLMEIARQRLEPRVRQREDEHDVMQSMYKSFCNRLQRGQFDLGNRRDVWNLLLTMTLNKVRDAAVRNQRDARDVRRERRGRAAGMASASAEDLANLIGDAAPTAEDVTCCTEMLARLLAVIPNERDREILLMRVEGFTNEDIAFRFEVSVRTVERVMEDIREKWADLEGDGVRQLTAEF